MPLPSENPLTFRSDDTAKWGIGKGAVLTSPEVDNNFWSLLLMIADLQSNPAQPNDIQAINVSAGQITFTLTNGEEFGPFDLPQQAFHWTDAFQGGFDYKRFDVFTANDGAYLVLSDHTSIAPFDPARTDLTGPLYGLLFPFQNIYDASFFYPGKPGFGLDVGDVMFALRFARDAFLPADLPGSVAGFAVNPSEAAWVADIQKNGVSIGSYTFDPFASSGAVGFFTFAADVQFNSNDLLEVIRPAGVDSAGTLDATAKGFTLTLAAKKGLI